MPQAYIALGASGCLIMIRYDATDMDFSCYDCVSSNVVFLYGGLQKWHKSTLSEGGLDSFHWKYSDLNGKGVKV